MAIQMRQGNEVDFDAEKMLPGEWAVSTDARIVRMCFAHGVVVRMATYEAFEADMEQIRDVLAEAKTAEEAIERIRDEIHDTEIMVENYALSAKSYAVGSTGVRDDEDTDNAKYYYEQSKRIAQGVNGIVPMGTITFEELPTGDVVNNAMYNISNAFTSDERFNDGGGVYYGAGNNVVWTASGKWDVTAASGVTGIKGENEIDYRQGNVNITRDNIGLGDDVFGTADISAIGDGTVKGAIKEHDSKFLPLTGGTLSGSLYVDKGHGYLGSSKGYGTYLGNVPDIGDLPTACMLIVKNYTISETKDALVFEYRDKNGSNGYKIFGEHNKPSGTYTGNGSTELREIAINGVGNWLAIWGKGMVILSPHGCIAKTGSVAPYSIDSGYARYDAHKLILKTDDTALNMSGVTYYYEVL